MSLTVGTSTWSNYLQVQPTDATNIDEVEFTSSNEEVVTVAKGEKFGGGYFCNVNCLAEGEVTVTATLGELTDTFTITVAAPTPITSISFPEDMPSTIGPYGPTGEIEGTFVIEPENADLSNLTITSSEPTMLEADLRVADKSQFILSTTQSAVNNTEVTITVTDGTVSETHTITIVIP